MSKSDCYGKSISGDSLQTKIEDVVEDYDHDDVHVRDGLLSEPSISWVNDRDSGWYRNGGVIRFAIDGVEKITYATNLLTVAEDIQTQGSILCPNEGIRTSYGSAVAPSYTFTGFEGGMYYDDGNNHLILANGSADKVLVKNTDTEFKTNIVLPAQSTVDNDAGEGITFSDAGSSVALTAGGGNRLTVNGSTSINTTIPIYSADGTISNPAYTFSADPDTGLHRIGDNNIGITVGGNCLFDLSANILQLGRDAVPSTDLDSPILRLGSKCMYHQTQTGFSSAGNTVWTFTLTFATDNAAAHRQSFGTIIVNGCQTNGSVNGMREYKFNFRKILNTSLSWDIDVVSDIQEGADNATPSVAISAAASTTTMDVILTAPSAIDTNGYQMSFSWESTGFIYLTNVSSALS